MKNRTNIFLSIIFLSQISCLSAQCIEGNCIQGEGKIIYKNNDTYEGYFKDGFRHGQGILVQFTKTDQITSKGLFIYDKIIQGNKLIKNLKHGFESLVTVTYKTYLGKITNKTNLYSGPSDQFDILLILNSDSNVLILSDKEINNFYNVIDIDSNTEGYLYISNVELIEEKKPEKNNVFEIIGNTTDILTSEITIYNSHHTACTIKLGTESFNFDPKETKTISVKPGNYRIFLSSKGTIPYVGEIELLRGKKYYRERYVKTIYN